MIRKVSLRRKRVENEEGLKDLANDEQVEVRMRLKSKTQRKRELMVRVRLFGGNHHTSPSAKSMSLVFNGGLG